MTLALGSLASFLLLAAPAARSSAPPPPPCPPAGMTRADLSQLKQSKFVVPSAENRNLLATRLLSCLDDPDPAIRDGVVFEALSTWLRSKALTPITILAIEDSLRTTLSGAKDAAGFRLPFAALALSEVARADRIDPVLPDPVRRDLVEVAARSLTRVDDYRGFDPAEGWRHGVAHGSDLVLQLGVNPLVGAEGLRRLMDAIASQIAPLRPGLLHLWRTRAPGPSRGLYPQARCTRCRVLGRMVRKGRGSEAATRLESSLRIVGGSGEAAQHGRLPSSTLIRGPLHGRRGRQSARHPGGPGRNSDRELRPRAKRRLVGPAGTDGGGASLTQCLRRPWITG